ncbi:MAG TPA: hypothetical protein VLB81_00155 [Gaiellales bacterium]|nr:hypothetical protein [Gaiellales bacterium]
MIAASAVWGQSLAQDAGAMYRVEPQRAERQSHRRRRATVDGGRDAFALTVLQRPSQQRGGEGDEGDRRQQHQVQILKAAVDAAHVRQVRGDWTR